MKAFSNDNLFFHLVVNPAWPYRLVRYCLLWTTVLFSIHRGFLFIAERTLDPVDSERYANLATLFFGGLAIGTYWAVTCLTRQFVLVHFQIGWLVLGLLIIHVSITQVVCWHFLLFDHYLTLAKLPKMYTAYQRHVRFLPFWQAPFDTIIVGVFSFSFLYNYILYAVGFKVFKDLFTMKLDQIKLEQVNTQLEFTVLKAQVNPHFLFNTLNNIYSFSIKSPDKVAGTILKLAELMRYSLYETEAERVLLAKELTFIDSYIQLQRIRHEADVHITYSVQGDPGQVTIPPMLFIVFVENAFKHGLQSSTRAGWVHVCFTIETGQLTLTINNSQPLHQTSIRGGIGLINVQKRLDQFYPGQYTLVFNKTADVFSVHLALQLHE